jgi:hypothetical protein
VRMARASNPCLPVEVRVDATVWCAVGGEKVKKSRLEDM